jgi:hypothetical protein
VSADQPSSGRDPAIDAEVESALRAVDGPKARPEFRAELRTRFLAAAGTAAASPHAELSSRHPASSAAYGTGERSRLGPLIGALLAAGLVLALGYFVFRPSPPSWRVLQVAPGSVVKADGISVPVQDPVALARQLEGAKEIEVESGDVILQVGDVSLFDLDEGTRVAFRGLDDTDAAVTIQVQASSGRLRARTGPDFRGRTMRVQADLMEVFVTGTAFALDYESHGTCICCLHGELQVTSKTLGPDPKPVSPDQMCLIYRAKDDSKWGGHPQHHAKPLRSLEELARTIWP